MKIMTFRQTVPEMYLLAAFFVLFLSHTVRSGEQAEHRDFQYNSVVDPMTGKYNFAYDTGNENHNEIAHTMHMQYRDANGIVRGRYGYTDPRGKMRVVEYEAGPKGFVARGDVGPDQSLHDQTPETQLPQTASYTQEEDLQLDPRPVQMSGWDPLRDPMGEPISSGNTGTSSEGEEGASGTVAGSNDFSGYSTSNNTSSDAVDIYIPVLDPYSARYPRLSVSTNENPNERELESLSSQTTGDETKSGVSEEIYPVAVPETVNNIDVNPDDIREAASGQSTVARSADGGTSRSSSSSLPYSYRNYLRQTHDHEGEIASPYRSVYIPSHGHYHYIRQPHNHEAEKSYYYLDRYMHDHDSQHRYHNHDADRRYYVSRYTHDHDAEKKYPSNRQTHDHDAERRYYVNRQTHDHDAERASYYSTIHRQNNPHRRRIFYKDSHSMVPHEHYSDIYHNDRSHQHSDVHLYGTSQNLQVPPTAKPGQIKYISSDKYHDKYYYWTD